MNEQIVKTEDTQMCLKCKEQKNLKEFYKNNAYKDGLNKKCKSCYKKSFNQNKERLLQEHIKFQKENPIKEKSCSHCEEVKPISEFGKRKDSKDGYFAACKICRHKKNKKYDLKHKKEKKCRMQQRYIDHKEEIILSSKKYYAEHPEECKLAHKKWHSEHKEKQSLKHKQYNSEPKNKEKRRKRENNKRKTDIIFRTKKNIRCRTSQAFKDQGVKKSMHTFEMLGCTPEFFQNYLEARFKPGMTRENNGKIKWHKHHIIPFEDVDLSDPEQLKKVCHYTNIIPMWKDDHKILHGSDLKKRNKIIKKYNLEKYYKDII